MGVKIQIQTPESLLYGATIAIEKELERNFSPFNDSFSKEKIAKLKKMGKPTKEKINKIMGNDSWTKNHCDCCDKEQNFVAEIWNEQKTEKIISICTVCLYKIKIMFNDTVIAIFTNFCKFCNEFDIDNPLTDEEIKAISFGDCSPGSYKKMVDVLDGK